MIRRRPLGLVAALVTLAVLGGSGSAVAAWTAAASTTGSASSATVKTTLSQTGLTPAAAQQYTTGTAPQVLGSLTLKNEGTAPLEYTLALAFTGDATLAAKTRLTLWTAATCGATPGADAQTTTLADPAPALPASARKLDAGATRVVCVATQIAGTDGTTTNAALQGQKLTATFTATGKVGTWTAAAPAASFTQSVFRLGPAGTITCNDEQNLFGSSLQLSWKAPSPRPAGDITYEIVNAETTAVVATVTSSSDTVSQTLAPSAFGDNGTYRLSVVASESVFKTKAVPTAVYTITKSRPFLLTRLYCS